MRAVTDFLTGSKLLVRTTVADGIILVTVAGTVGSRAPDAFGNELTEACQLCTGVVVLDVRRCEINGRCLTEVVRGALQRAVGCRCRVQVITADRDIAEACFATGISCTRRPASRSQERTLGRPDQSAVPIKPGST
ncbi:hypothetical protein [Amycolatopsis sp. NPDC004378]